MVTLSYGHGYLTDCDDTTGFGEVTGGSITGTSLTVENGDYFKLEGTCNDANDEYVYYEKTLATSLSSDVYTNFLIRYKTSAASNGLGAKTVLTFSDASTQTILGATAPQFSTTWTVTSGTITSGKTITKVRFTANDYPESVASGTYQVYFDFLLLYKGQFTLPNVAGGMNINFPPRVAFLQVPSRDVDITQNLGTRSAVVTLSCDLDQGNWKRTGDTIDGEVFLDILHNRSSEPWQWLNTGSHQFKVTVHPQFSWRDLGESVARWLDLTLTEYSLGDKSSETYAERFGIG